MVFGVVRWRGFICVHVLDVLSGKSPLDDIVLVEFNFVPRSRYRHLGWIVSLV